METRRSESGDPGSPAQMSANRFGSVWLTRRRFMALSTAAAASLLAACGGDDEPAPTATTAPRPTQASTGAPTATSGTSAAASPSASPGAIPTQRTGTASAALPKEAAPGKPGGKKIFKIGFPNDILNMDPAKITGGPDYQFGEAIYNFIGRYTYNPPFGTDIIPELAEKWELTPDGKIFTFFLRKGVKYHRNLGELTAEDVKWNWERIQDPKTASRYQTDFEGARFEVVDQHTLKVGFDNPYPSFIRASLAFRPGLIVSPKAMQELGEAWKTNPAGTGAFTWGKLEPGTSLTMDRFDGYWGQKPKIDQIFARFKIDNRAGVLAVARGELDAIYIDDTDIAMDVQRRTDPNTIFVKAEFGEAPYWFAFNMKRKPFDDIRVRQAMRYAIDVEAIAKDLMGGLADPIHSFLPPFMFGYSDQITKFNYDPNKAKQMLREAGVDLNSWEPNVLGQGTSAEVRRINQAVVSYWNDVGVKAKNDLVEQGVFAQRRASGDYDIFSISVGRIEPDQIATPYWKTGSPVNNSFYTAADDLIDRAKAEPDPAKAKELYRQLQEKISVDSPAAFIVAVSRQLLVNKRVAGLAGASWQNRYDWFNVDVPAE